jgi:hypothetical protein
MVELTESERAELLAMLNSRTVSARAATRARIVLWRSDGCLKKDVASRAGVSRPTVDAALKRFAMEGAAGLLDKPVKILRRERVPARGAGADSRCDTFQPTAGDGAVALVQP